MATGSGGDRDDRSDGPVGAAHFAIQAGRGPDDLESRSVDALGSQPVPLQPPSVLRTSVLPAIAGSRSLWPVIAILGSVIAVLGAGLFVLAGRPPRRTTAVAPPAVVAVSASAADPVRAERRPSEPYGAAIRSHARELHRCASDDGEAFPPDAEAIIVVGVDGRAKQVTLQPDGAEHSQLGVCIRRVLQAVAFPAAPDEKEVAVGLAVYR